jgi:hypothetical protein
MNEATTTLTRAGLQGGNAGVFGGCGSLQFSGGLAAGQLQRAALVLLGQAQPFMQLLLELAVANLFDDVGVAGLVNFEGGVAMGANDVVHGGLLWGVYSKLG